MDRTLESNPAIKPRPGDEIVLLPGASEAEPWEAWIVGTEQSRLLHAYESPRSNPWQKRSTFVLPAAQVFCLPLWLNETQADRFGGMIELQLEARGMAGRAGSPAIYQWSLVAHEEKRSLILVGILPPDLPLDFRITSYQTFEASPRYFSWPDNALVLWMEQGQLVATFSRGTNLVYFQGLGEDTCSDRLIQTLVCLRASLEIQGILSGLGQVVLWTELPEDRSEALGNQLGVPVRAGERPTPSHLASRWNLCPPEIAQSKKDHHSRRWQGRALAAFFVLYLLAALIFVTRYFLLSHQAEGLRQWQTANAPALAFIDRAHAQWTRLQPVVDTANYPLEVLLHCTAAIPKDQLHLTLFQMENENVLLKGEATNVAAAYQLFDHLKAEKELSNYDWKMDEPHLQSNDLAQLQLEGTRAAFNP